MLMLAQESSDGSFTPWIISVLLYALVVAAWIFWSWKQAGKREPILTYSRTWLLGHPIRLVVLLVLGFFAPVVLGFGALLLIPALIVYAWLRAKLGVAKERARRLSRFQHDPARYLTRWGESFEQRDAAIRAAFDQSSEVLEHVVGYEFDDVSDNGTKDKSILGFRMTRGLAAMEPRYREALRAVELLNNAAEGQLPSYRWMRLGLLWGDGKGTVDDFVYWMFNTQARGIKNGTSVVEYHLGREDLTAEAAINKLLETLGKPPINERYARVQAEMRGVFLGGSSSGGVSGPAWLSPGEVGGTLFRVRSEHSLLLGRFEDGTPLEFSGDESLITIAPPGSGKTQCNVFPNLLRWKGPAVVLDVSGDLYANTSLWRSRNVGPVFKFAPLDPGGTHRYSPLAFVRNEPDFI